MSRHIFVSPSGRPSARWREAFSQGAALTPESLDAGVPAGGTVLWVCTQAGELPALVARLVRLRPDLPVVALDLQPSKDMAAAAFEAGARGYCHALATAPMLAQVAIVVSHGGLWVGPELLSRLVGVTHRMAPGAIAVGPEFDSLTARERAVAEEVARGATNKEVARNLGITERTVKAHLGAAFAKLGVRDRLHLALGLQSRAETEIQPV
jgi:two-component system, NarL family, nitrate/nitrite response regulator NarL